MPINQGAENVGKILVVGTDGKLTLMDMPDGGVSGDVVGVLDDNNNILLTGALADGTYTLKYVVVDAEGNESYTDIGTLEVGEIPEVIEPVTVDVALVENTRVSLSAGGHTNQSGCTATEVIDLSNIPKPCTIHLTGIKWSALSADNYDNYVASVIKKEDGTTIQCSYTSPTLNGGTLVVNDSEGKDVTVTITNTSAYSAVFGGRGAIADASATLTYTPET